MKFNKELMKGSTATLILKLLEKEDMYGYRITQELKMRSNDLIDMKEGTLYPTLHTLEKSGIVESYWLDSSEGRRRKYYRITEKGILSLTERQSEWELFKQTIESVIGGGEEHEYT